MQIIEPSYENSAEKALVEEFLKSGGRKKYILGINKLTKSVQKNIRVDGVIDDFTRVQRSRKKEILKIESVPKDAIILWTSSGSPLEVKRRLDAMGFSNISYLALLKYSSLDLAPHPFIMDFKEDYKRNKHLYEQTYNLNHAGQYFERDILPDLKEIVFVDGGGYVGDTAAEVIKNYPDYKKIYLIEPIKEHLRIAKRDLAEHANIEFIEAGLSNKKKQLFFHEEKSFSTLYQAGSQSVQVDTIDNIVCERVDYIKLDIEGSELEAIEGAKETILKYKPILAICIYHKAEDWHKVPQRVLSINSDYKIYLRHYMEGIFESVMYFIPRLNRT